MVVQCEEVWREVSNYLEGETAPELRTAMEAHLRVCSRCQAVLAGTRNVIGLYGEENMIQPPLGYSQRLRHRLEQNLPGKRGTAFGWMVAAAVAVLLVGTFEVGRSSSFLHPTLRSKLAQPANSIPPDMMVVVSEEGKTFHAPGCTFLHDKKLRTITAKEAQKEGYAPCVRCLKKYLTESADGHPAADGDEEVNVAER
jgi:hypothetical protein